MALVNVEQHFWEQEEQSRKLTFKDCARQDIFSAFLNETEHAEVHDVDDKKNVTVIFEDNRVKRHNAHWEGGAKQNFDTGLYEVLRIMYISVKDYGPRPKSGKLLVLDKGTKTQKTFTIRICEEEDGLYRMTIDRVRQ